MAENNGEPAKEKLGEDGEDVSSDEPLAAADPDPEAPAPEVEVLPEAEVAPKVVAAPEVVAEPDVVAKSEEKVALELAAAPEVAAKPDVIAEPKEVNLPEEATVKETPPTTVQPINEQKPVDAAKSGTDSDVEDFSLNGEDVILGDSPPTPTARGSSLDIVNAKASTTTKDSIATKSSMVTKGSAGSKKVVNKADSVALKAKVQVDDKADSTAPKAKAKCAVGVCCYCSRKKRPASPCPARKKKSKVSYVWAPPKSRSRPSFSATCPHEYEKNTKESKKEKDEAKGESTKKGEKKDKSDIGREERQRLLAQPTKRQWYESEHAEDKRVRYKRRKTTPQTAELAHPKMTNVKGTYDAQKDILSQEMVNRLRKMLVEDFHMNPDEIESFRNTGKRMRKSGRQSKHVSKSRKKNLSQRDWFLSLIAQMADVATALNDRQVTPVAKINNEDWVQEMICEIANEATEKVESNKPVLGEIVNLIIESLAEVLGERPSSSEAASTLANLMNCAADRVSAWIDEVLNEANKLAITDKGEYLPKASVGQETEVQKVGDQIKPCPVHGDVKSCAIHNCDFDGSCSSMFRRKKTSRGRKRSKTPKGKGRKKEKDESASASEGGKGGEEDGKGGEEDADEDVCQCACACKPPAKKKSKQKKKKSKSVEKDNTLVKQGKSNKKDSLSVSSKKSTDKGKKEEEKSKGNGDEQKKKEQAGKGEKNTQKEKQGKTSDNVKDEAGTSDKTKTPPKKASPPSSSEKIKESGAAPDKDADNSTAESPPAQETPPQRDSEASNAEGDAPPRKDPQASNAEGDAQDGSNTPPATGNSDAKPKDSANTKDTDGDDTPEDSANTKDTDSDAKPKDSANTKDTNGDDTPKDSANTKDTDGDDTPEDSANTKDTDSQPATPPGASEGEAQGSDKSQDKKEEVSSSLTDNARDSPSTATEKVEKEIKKSSEQIAKESNKDGKLENGNDQQPQDVKKVIFEMLSTMIEQVHDNEVTGDRSKLAKTLDQKISGMIKIEEKAGADSSDKERKEAISVVADKMATWMQDIMDTAAARTSSVDATVSAKRVPSKVTSGDLRQWTEWMDKGLTDAADWAQWVSKTVAAAEDKAAKKRGGMTTESGTPVKLTRKEWEQWKADLKTDVVALRMKKKVLTEEAHDWKLRTKGKPFVGEGSPGASAVSGVSSITAPKVGPSSDASPPETDQGSRGADQDGATVVSSATSGVSPTPKELPAAEVSPAPKEIPSAEVSPTPKESPAAEVSPTPEDSPGAEDSPTLKENAVAEESPAPEESAAAPEPEDALATSESVPVDSEKNP